MNNYRGFSLPSMLLNISIASLIVITTNSAVNRLLQPIQQRYQRYHLTVMLQQQLNRIAQEVKRAGFSNITYQPPNKPPLKNPVIVDHHPGELKNSCLLFYYDRNRNALIGYQKIAATIGYRLHQGNLETQHGVQHCHGGRWEDLLDKQVITLLRFQLLYLPNNRWIQLTLLGKLTQHPQIIQQLQAVVFLENLP